MIRSKMHFVKLAFALSCVLLYLFFLMSCSVFRSKSSDLHTSKTDSSAKVESSSLVIDTSKNEVYERWQFLIPAQALADGGKSIGADLTALLNSASGLSAGMSDLKNHSSGLKDALTSGLIPVSYEKLSSQQKGVTAKEQKKTEADVSKSEKDKVVEKKPEKSFLTGIVIMLGLVLSLSVFLFLYFRKPRI